MTKLNNATKTPMTAYPLLGTVLLIRYYKENVVAIESKEVYIIAQIKGIIWNYLAFWHIEREYGIYDFK